MKGRYSTLDIGVIVNELKRFLGMRVVNVYDIDNKTYLIKLAKPDEKTVLMLESGIRLHSTDFDWPKNPAPSGFSMKMRKHLKGRRFEKIDQLGVDRIVDMQFGSGEAAYHVILELYDRGNIVLTDSEYIILNILRPRTDKSEDVRFAVREVYPITTAKHHQVPTEERLREILRAAKAGDSLKRVLVSHLDYGPAVLDHCLLEAGFSENMQIGKGFSVDTDMGKLMMAIQMAETLMTTLISKPCKGYIFQRVDKKPNPKDGESSELLTYDEFHPFLFSQMTSKSNIEFDSFDKAVDEFFSKLESQKLDVKVLQQEKAAMKKLDNVKKDHEKRICELQKEQDLDIMRGQLIEMNLELVDQAILIVRSALANQIDWTEIGQLVKEAQATGDKVAKAIAGLKLETNHITLALSDPFEGEDADKEHTSLKPMKVDIDLGLSAYANSRKFFDKKRQAAKKEQKTMEASNKALKSAEKKTKETLKDMATAASINKTRKTYWFEKFLWFISSENYLVIGGRDQQQNELIVKRYLKSGDLYVHADLHGASSVVLKNPTGGDVPPKTLNEAGTMAICHSAAWDAKVVTSAWWVRHDQVSKTAPSGEYLTTGSFMIRGKKNYLPPSYLIYGFGFLFKLEEGSVARHAGERRVKTIEDDLASTASDLESTTIDSIHEENDTVSDDNDNDDDDSSQAKEEDEDGDEDNEKGKKDDSDSDDAGDKEEKEGGRKREGHKTEGTVKDLMETGGSCNWSSGDPSSELQFPDTSINLTHVSGTKFELQRLSSVQSTSSSVTDDEPDVICLGDNNPVTFGSKGANRVTGRLSAKQRREMRKARKGGVCQKGAGKEDEEQWEEEEGRLEASAVAPTSACQQQVQEAGQGKEEEAEEVFHPHQHSQPLKRGQKNKLRKIKEKYGDQDEEERKLKMELLASSGPQKEDKRKKGKKGKEDNRAKGGKQTAARPPSGKGQVRSEGHPKSAATGASVEDTGKEAEVPRPVGFIKEEAVDGGSDGEQDNAEEDGQQTDDMQILNSLTGQPHTEDELLYALPCCAPYNALTAYKFKVKLLPGTTKRGKAAKTALNMFHHDKAASAREKDLLRIMKDADLSRNMPGKVKVAAPKLHKR